MRLPVIVLKTVCVSVYSHIFKHNIIDKNRKEIKPEKIKSKARLHVH